MKVLIIQPFISYGGAEAVSLQLAYHLGKLGHQAKVAALFADKKRLPHLGKKVAIVTAPAFLAGWFSQNRFLLVLIGFPFLFYLVWRESREVEVLNPHNFPSWWLASLVGKGRKIPVVWTVHNLPQRVLTGKTSGQIWDWLTGGLDKILVKRIEKIVAVSEKVKRQVKNLYGRESLVLTPAIEGNFWARGKGKKMRKKYGWEKKKVLLNVGRLTKEKNQGLLIKSFARVSQKIPEAILVLVGEGKEEKSLKFKVPRQRAGRQSLKLDRKVFFVGYQPPERVRDFYAACDLNLVPAFATEGCNLTPLEALCQGKVSLVAKGSGIDEFLGKEKIGLVAKPTTVDFSQKILTALRTQKLAKMGEKGRQFVLRQLNWESYARKMVSILKD